MAAWILRLFAEGRLDSMKMQSTHVSRPEPRSSPQEGEKLRTEAGATSNSNEFAVSLYCKHRFHEPLVARARGGKPFAASATP